LRHGELRNSARNAPARADYTTAPIGFSKLVTAGFGGAIGIADNVVMTHIDFDRYDRVRALRWHGDRLDLLDQRALPHRQEWMSCTDAEAVASAIRDLVVRGAPAIGIAAAYGVVLAARSRPAAGDHGLAAAIAVLRASRPTAVNLFWALDRMQRARAAGADAAALEREARAIEAEDLAANRHMGRLGAERFGADCGVLTHCNTGSLATAGFGTALGVIRAGVAMGRVRRVYNTETRPWLQGARLTSFELHSDGIASQLIADGAGAHLFSTGKVQWLVVGADRICANGDTANKIGTCALAVAARHFGVRTMIVAPSTTVDMATARGADIHIELRAPQELLAYAGTRVAPDGVDAWNPVFDVTPAGLIDCIVTERGVVERPDAASMAAVFGAASTA
jgi:methylthioribose-1-phosphate isomerase